MPIFVDHGERRLQIIKAAGRVLATAGYAKFTLRAVGQEMGGSVTMVTHYFGTRDELIEAMLGAILEEAVEEQAEIAAMEDPHDRLKAVLMYFLPINDEALATERARVALSSNRLVDPRIQKLLNILEPKMRDLVRSAVQDFIPADRLEATVDLIRLWTGGVVLAAVEHPEIWTPERQEQALEYFLDLVELPLAAAYSIGSSRLSRRLRHT